MRVTEASSEEVSIQVRLNNLNQLANLCIEVLQQNEEHHSEVR